MLSSREQSAERLSLGILVPVADASSVVSPATRARKRARAVDSRSSPPESRSPLSFSTSSLTVVRTAAVPRPRVTLPSPSIPHVASEQQLAGALSLLVPVSDSGPCPAPAAGPDPSASASLATPGPELRHLCQTCGQSAHIAIRPDCRSLHVCLELNLATAAASANQHADTRRCADSARVIDLGELLPFTGGSPAYSYYAPPSTTSVFLPSHSNLAMSRARPVAAEPFDDEEVHFSTGTTSRIVKRALLRAQRDEQRETETSTPTEAIPSPLPQSQPQSQPRVEPQRLTRAEPQPQPRAEPLQSQSPFGELLEQLQQVRPLRVHYATPLLTHAAGAPHAFCSFLSTLYAVARLERLEYCTIYSI